MTAIAGRTVVITGGAGGLGRRMAEGIARAGGRPVLWDRDEPALRGAVEDLRAATGAPAAALPVDVTDRTAVREAAERTAAEHGPVAILINSAGVVAGRPLLEADPEQIRTTFEVNTLALYWTTRALLPGMLERGRGHLVTIASAAGLVGVARQTDYAASKWAAVGFDESLRAELRGTARGVRTTVVCPYYVDTGMFAGVKTRFPWLLPILEEDEVARQVLRAVIADRRRLVLPPFVRLLPLARILPPRWFDRLMDVLGVNATMDHFRGRAGAGRNS